MASGREGERHRPLPGDGPGTGEPDPTGSAVVPREVQLAAWVLYAQAAGLVIATTVLLVKTLTGHPDSVGRALLAAAFAVLGAALLAVAGRSFLFLRTGLRTPVVVIELLALPVGWSLGFQAGRVGYAGPLLVSALAVLYLLFTPAGRRALERRL